MENRPSSHGPRRYHDELGKNKPDSITKTYGIMSADSISKQVLERFLSGSNEKGLHYAMEGYSKL